MLSAVSVCRPRCLVPSQAAKLFLCNKLLHNSGSSKVNDCSFFPCLVCCLCRDDRTLLSTCGHPAGETSRVIVMPLPLTPPHSAAQVWFFFCRTRERDQTLFNARNWPLLLGGDILRPVSMQLVQKGINAFILFYFSLRD